MKMFKATKVYAMEYDGDTYIKIKGLDNLLKLTSLSIEVSDRLNEILLDANGEGSIREIGERS